MILKLSLSILFNIIPAAMPDGGIMDSNHIDNETPERRSEERSADERYYSVQFTTEALTSFYQFKLWNISAGGMCILVKEDSEILNHLSVGDTLEMTYYIADSQGGTDNLKTKIRHITKNENGRFQGHCLVGLSIL
jgi:hypothetical protein